MLFIKKLIVKNFRSLKDIKIEFSEDNLICIAGENDAGKTSLIDCIRVFSDSPYQVSLEDFYKTPKEQAIEIEITVELNDGSRISKIFRRKEASIKQETKKYIPCENLKKRFNNIKSLLLNNTEKQYSNLNYDEKQKIQEIYSLIFNQNIRPNTKIRTILDRLQNEITNCMDFVEVSSDSKISLYYLDNKTIENPAKVLDTLFLCDIKKQIWETPINDSGKTIKEVVLEKIEDLKRQKEQEFSQILTKVISEYLGEQVSIKIDAELKDGSLPINFTSRITDELGNEISFDNKGDGTKRRITMALIELKLLEKDPSIFILDEPDTHLHVKAQRKLLNILKKASETKQIIITTHSPFILNLLKPTQVKVLYLETENNNGKFTKIKNIRRDSSYQMEKILQDLGIENISLFFSRKIVITEEKTCKVFLEYLYSKHFGITPYGDFIKIIEGNSVTDATRLIRVLIEDLHFNIDKIFLAVDKDIEKRKEDNTFKILKELRNKGWKEKDNLIKIGQKEFEDAFTPEQIYEAWKRFVESKGKRVGENWTIENIKKAYSEALERKKKLKELLKPLNSGTGIPFEPTDNFPKALAEYFAEHFEELPECFRQLIEKLKED